MARYTTAAPVAALNGNLGGLLFYSGSKCQRITLRQRHTKAWQGEALAQQVRLSTAAAGWRSLTSDQQKAWKLAAAELRPENKLSSPSSVSGFDAYVMYNATYSRFQVAAPLPPTYWTRGTPAQYVVPSWTIGGDLYLDQSNWPPTWPSYEHYSIARHLDVSRALYTSTFTPAFDYTRSQHNANLKVAFHDAGIDFTAAEFFMLKVTQLHTGFFPTRPVFIGCFIAPA